jgi:predicted phage terminase large subunit-like protein
MIFMPPGSAKSTYASVVAPTYLMGKIPDYRLILASYGSDLAKRHGRRARQIVGSIAFASMMGCGLLAGNAAADEWALTNGSEYLARGILSGVTGNRAHGIVIDDPIKGREQADSPTIRDKTWQAYQDDLLTRLIPGGWVALIQTRWHEDDLAGRLLPKDYKGQSGLVRCQDGLDWEILNLPAECEQADDPLGRKIGEFLWPEWFDQGHWAIFKAQSRTWAALYQGRPRPDGGGIFKEGWCSRRYGVIPFAANVCVHSWDTAQKEQQFNDPTACTIWRFGPGAPPGYYLREVYRDRVDYPTLRRKIIAYADRDKPHAILIEDKSSGQSLIQDLRNSTSLPIIAIEPEGNKIFRASEVSGLVEAGLVHLPEPGGIVDQDGRQQDTPWLPDFEGEFFGFPLSTNDDQVDSASQFLKWVRGWIGRIETYGAGMPRTLASEMGRQSDEGYGSVGRVDGDTNGFM